MYRVQLASCDGAPITRLPNELLVSIFNCFRAGIVGNGAQPEPVDGVPERMVVSPGSSPDPSASSPPAAQMQSATPPSEHPFRERLREQERSLLAVCLTCKHWATLASPLLWQVRVLDVARAKAAEEFVRTVCLDPEGIGRYFDQNVNLMSVDMLVHHPRPYFRYGSYIERLRIDIGANLTPGLVRCVAENCPNLKYLCLVGQPSLPASDELPWGEVARSCTRLDSFVLMNCRASRGLIDFATACAPLRRLAIINCPDLPFEFYVRLFSRCAPSLRRVYLRDFDALISNDILVALSNYCPLVQDIWLGLPKRKEYTPAAISSQAFHQVLAALPHLRHLSLMCFVNIEDLAFYALANQRELCVLELPMMLKNVSADALSVVAQNLVSLQTLTLTAPNVTPHFVRTLFDGKPALESVKLYGLQQRVVQDVQFQELGIQKYITEKGGLPALNWCKQK